MHDPQLHLRLREHALDRPWTTQDYRDATIYANWNGAKYRVGMVIDKTTETFSIPWLYFEVRLQVDFGGGGELKVADSTPVHAGDQLSFIIMHEW